MIRHTRRAALGLMGLVFAGLTATGASAATRSLRGTVTFRERIALPPSAILTVRLVDVSLADAPARTIAETTMKTHGRVPIAYRLRYDSTRIRKNRRYALQARIEVDGRLWFTTTEHHAVFTGKPGETDIRVQRVSSNALDDDELAGRWLAESILGGGVIDRLQTILEIGSEGRVTGTGGCNRFSGRARISGSTIRFTPLAATQMACTPAAMDQERKFFQALEDVRRWEVNRAHRKLALLDGGGKPLAVFARM